MNTKVINNRALRSNSSVERMIEQIDKELSKKDNPLMYMAIHGLKIFISKIKEVLYTRINDTDLNAKEKHLKRYQFFLERLAEEQSSELFSNGGIEHASILMSVLLKNTDRIARIFSNGFKPDLIMTQPYWNSLKEFLENPNNTLLVLVETDKYQDQAPMQLLKTVIEKRKELVNGDGVVVVKLLSSNGKDLILKKFGNQHCNFAVYDDNKFRFEYDPDNFKAYGSFNQPKNCKILKDVFDNAFEQSSVLW